MLSQNTSNQHLTDNEISIKDSSHISDGSDHHVKEKSSSICSSSKNFSNQKDS